jgi:hypothetical protein
MDGEKDSEHRPQRRAYTHGTFYILFLSNRSNNAFYLKHYFKLENENVDGKRWIFSQQLFSI